MGLGHVDANGDLGGSGETAGGPLDGAIRRILDFARAHLGMEVAWVSRFTSGRQMFEYVTAADGACGPVQGSSAALKGSYCLRVLDGRLPAYIVDARANPGTRDLAVTSGLGIGSYVGVPVTRRGSPTCSVT